MPDLLKRLHTATPSWHLPRYQEHLLQPQLCPTALVTQGTDPPPLQSSSSTAALSCSALHHCHLLRAQPGELPSLESSSTSSAGLLHPGPALGTVWVHSHQLWVILILQEVSAIKGFCPESSLKALKQRSYLLPNTE